MPCSDGGPSREYVEMENGIRASWCAILAVLEKSDQLDSILNTCDWAEAGVTKAEVLGWWAHHKREDAQRLAWDEADRRKSELKKQALGKLSAEEREALR